MIIELATLPIPIQEKCQQFIAKIKQGESVSVAKDGKIVATTHQPQQSQPIKSLVERFSQSNPAVTDIDLEFSSRQLSSQDSIKICD